MELYMKNEKAVPIFLAIGASTGGPSALAKILTKIPADLPIATVIVQHTDVKFMENLADWLQKKTERPVKLIDVGDTPQAGVVFLASQNQHLILRHTGTFSYTSFPKTSSHTPSIDIFFQSLSLNWPQKSIALLLTGMGNDGALGMKSLRDKGWHTIAEHEKSCAIYGMPQAAIEAGGVEEIVECSYIPAAILAAYHEIAKTKGS